MHHVTLDTAFGCGPLRVGRFAARRRLVGVWLAFGVGRPYPDLYSTPTLPQGTIEVALESARPIGNATVSADGRIFYTIQPESKPKAPFLYEQVNGRAVSFPDESSQSTLFETPLGVAVDHRNRLWVIDPGNHGFGVPRLLAFDLKTNGLVHRFDFPRSISPIGSFLQDLQID